MAALPAGDAAGLGMSMRSRVELGTDVMSTEDVVEAGESPLYVSMPEWSDPRTWWEVAPDLVRRPAGASARVVGGLLPWGQHAQRRVIDLHVEPLSVSAARNFLWFMCWLWGIYEVGECAAACASELVANAIAHAEWPTEGRQRIPLVVSFSAGALLVEVCDPDPRLPLPRAMIDWETVDLTEPGDIGESGFGLGIVQHRVAELGGEFGCVSGVQGKSVFFALPMPKSAALLVSEDGAGVRSDDSC